MKKRMTLHEKAEMAMKEAVREVIESHKKSGRPLSTWSKGKVVYVSPHKVEVKKGL